MDGYLKISLKGLAEKAKHQKLAHMMMNLQRQVTAQASQYERKAKETTKEVWNLLQNTETWETQRAQFLKYCDQVTQKGKDVEKVVRDKVRDTRDTLAVEAKKINDKASSLASSVRSIALSYLQDKVKVSSSSPQAKAGVTVQRPRVEGTPKKVASSQKKRPKGSDTHKRLASEKPLRKAPVSTKSSKRVSTRQASAAL